MRNTDLFGQVVITHADVIKYLRTLPCFGDGTNRSKSAIEHYIKNYELSNKLILLKLNGSLEKLITSLDKIDQQRAEALDLDLFKPKYKEAWKRKPCPPYAHKCAFMDCEAFLAWRKRLVNRKYYLQRKKAAKCDLLSK